MHNDALRRLAEDRLDVRYKGLAPTILDATVGDLATRRPMMLEAGFTFPLLVLRRSAIEHNIAAMADYCDRYDVQLAPHGKTTMSPQLHAMQLLSGAWGLTAATVHQVAVYRSFGVERVLLANELVDPAAARWLSAELARDPGFEFFCYVDSVEGTTLLAEAVRGASDRGRIAVLVELGYGGGRAGCRDVDAVLAVARSVVAEPSLRLAGVAGYEGLIGHDVAPETLSAVTAYVRSLRVAASAVLDLGLYSGDRGTFIVSCGGSAYFDVVTRELGTSWPRRGDVTVVLRCGSYVSHDDGLYEHVSPFARDPGPGAPLQPAIVVWAHVLSVPEPGRVIVGVGRRDISFDSGLPRPRLIWPRGEPLPRALAGVAAVDLNDHHVFLEPPTRVRLAVGDLVGFGISHPCTTFDKWRLIPVVDDHWRVVDCIHTFF